jgi:hypothetical protein
MRLPGSVEPVAIIECSMLEPAYSGGSAPESNGIPLAPEYEKERRKNYYVKITGSSFLFYRMDRFGD